MFQPNPDKLAPSDTYITSEIDVAVKIRAKENSFEPMSLPTLLYRAARDAPNQLAFVFKDEEGKSQTMTFKEYLEEVQIISKAFIKIGLGPREVVGIMGTNRPEWIVSNMATVFANCVAVGIYMTSTPEACQFIASDSKASIIVAEDESQLSKFLDGKEVLAGVKAFILFEGSSQAEHIWSWKDLMELGQQEQADELRQRLDEICVNKSCNLSYTSGTTGRPKAVMVNHDSLIYSSTVMRETFGMELCNERVISYLPLSHLLSTFLDMILPLLSRATVHFAEKDALRGSMIKTLREIKPTIFFGVPRIWEKLFEATKDHTGDIKDFLGLSNCKYFGIGGAPSSKEILDFFLPHGIHLMEIYGTNEIGFAFANSKRYWRFGTIGKPVGPSGTKLVNGELLVTGRGLMMGYLGREDKNLEDFDSDLWFKTGDLATMDEDGFCHIVGRIKEVLITSGGENICPALLEETIRRCLPCVSNAMLVGDRRKFVSCLLTVKTEIDPDTKMPGHKLTKESIQWCNSHGSNAGTVQDLLVDTAAAKAIQAGIDEANTKAVSNAAKVKKWTILEGDFSVAGGEFGPTMKLRRPVVLEKYHEQIEEMYSV